MKQPEVKFKPVAWIITGPHGQVYHFAIADGWTVEPVLTDVPDGNLKHHTTQGTK